MVALQRGNWRRAARRLGQTIVYRAPDERDACPACASEDLSDLDVLRLRAGRTGFVTVCNECGLVFSNPLPARAQLLEFYSPSGEWASQRCDDNADAHQLDVPPVGLRWTRLFDPIREALNVASPPRGSRVLDFGCGQGKLLDMLQDRGWETYGIEPALNDAFRRHWRLHVVPDEPTFDLIVLMQVLEHVADPLAVLRQLARACHIGGHLLVSVPRFDTLPDHRDYRYVLNGRAHITAYTWACLRTLLARAGWAPVAPPPAQVGKGGGGRMTTTRLRVLARRAEGVIAGAAAPADEARAALTAYYAQTDTRPLMARAGFIRLTARRIDAARRTMKRERKALKHGAVKGARAV